MPDRQPIGGEPQPKGDFLAEVLDSLRRRGKALRHRARNLTVENVVERSGDDQRRKLEIECAFAQRTVLRLHVWQDRWVWVDVRKSVKSEGWAWEYTHQGRLSGDEPARRLIATMERSIEAATEASGEETAALSLTWGSVLALGPRGVAND